MDAMTKSVDSSVCQDGAIDAVIELATNGFVVLPGVISEATTSKLTAWLESKGIDSDSYNYFPGHDQARMPTSDADVPWEILRSEEIHQAVRSLLGSGYYMNSYTCNTNTASDDQPYHMDCSHYHQQHVRSLIGVGPAFELIVNVYLQDTDERNGSLDIIPGSHLVADVNLGEDGEVSAECLARIRCDDVHQRLNLPRGGIVIRDKRTWHRGTVNHSGVQRHLVSMRYNHKFFQSRPQRFDANTRESFSTVPFDIKNIAFVDAAEKNVVGD